jgi:hypothetical protein
MENVNNFIRLLAKSINAEKEVESNMFLEQNDFPRIVAYSPSTAKQVQNKSVPSILKQVQWPRVCLHQATTQWYLRCIASAIQFSEILASAKHHTYPSPYSSIFNTLSHWMSSPSSASSRITLTWPNRNRNSWK